MTARRIFVATTLIAVFTVIASLLLLYSAGYAGYYRYPYYQWWYYAWTQPGNFYVLASGAISLVIILAILFIGFRGTTRVRGWSLRQAWPVNRKPAGAIRARTAIYGTARWQTSDEGKRRWPGPAAPYGGIVVGEDRFTPNDCGPFLPDDPSSWGRRGRPLIDPLLDGPPHCIVVAGTGGYKTSCLVPTGCIWTGGAVFHDPSSELVQILYDTRQRMGHRVHVLTTEDQIDRIGAPAIPAAAFNALDWIDPTSTSAEIDVATVVEWVCGTTPRNAGSSERFFTPRAKNVVRCLLASLLWNQNCDPDLKTLETLRELIAVPPEELRKGLKTIHQTSKSPYAQNLAGAFGNGISEETFGSIHQTADELTAWLATESIARLVSGTSFRSADLAAGRTDVFLSLPLKVLQTSPQLARCIIGAQLNALYEAGGNVNGKILFMLDEAARLGYLGSLKIARDTGRKHGIALLLAYQNQKQIVDQWGPTGEAEWFGNVRWRSYSAITDPQTAEELSRSCGEYGAVDWSESVRRLRGLFGRPLPQLTYTTRPTRLISPSEIVSQRTDTQIVVGSPGYHPAKLGRAIYWRDKRFLAQVGSNPFAGQLKPELVETADPD
jgi:type IV secretion system protein VirD4